MDLNKVGDYKPWDMGFSFSFGIGQDLPANIGYYELNEVHYYYSSTELDSSGQPKRIKEKIPIPTQNCGDHYFNFIDQKQVAMFGINSLICPTNLNYSLHGDFYSKDFKYIEIRLQKCLNSTKTNATVCADENTINSFLDPL